MKKVYKLVIIFLVLLLIFSAVGIAKTSDIKIRFQIRNNGFDTDQNMYKEQVNISVNAPGYISYVEEYYTIDGNNNPKFSGSGRYDAGNGVKSGDWYNVTVDTLRPVPHLGKSYKLIKAVILLNDERIFEYWITRNIDFNDNTGSVDDGTESTLSETQNIDKYEAVEGRIVKDIPVTFKYSRLGIIDKVNVTGSGNEDITFRIDLLKGLSGLTYNPGGLVYKYLDMNVDKSNIKSLDIYYRIDNNWLGENGVPYKNIIMIAWNYDNKKWYQLPTHIINNDSEYTYYESLSDIPSKYAIVGVPPAKPKPTLGNTTELTKSAPGNVINRSDIPANYTVKPSPGFGIIAAFMALIYACIKRIR